MATETLRPGASLLIFDNLQELARLVASAVDSDTFKRGLGMGAEGVAHTDRMRRTSWVESPVTALVTQPAWEGSHVARLDEHNLAFALAGVIGAFAERAGIDIDSLVPQQEGATT